MNFFVIQGHTREQMDSEPWTTMYMPWSKMHRAIMRQLQLTRAAIGAAAAE